MAKKRGRPSKYDPLLDYNKIADNYLKTCGREQTKLPKLSEFAREYLQINDDTLVEWGKIHPEISATIKKIKDFQKEQLMDDGLYGGREVNNAMAIFLLKANHGMIETERKELVGADGEPIKITVVTGEGFVPASGGSPAEGQPPVQGIGLASEG